MPMGTLGPSINEVHVDAALTDFALALPTPEFIADRVFPRVQVRKESDKYFKFVRREELNPETGKDLRAPGDCASEFRWQAETDTYSAEEYAWRHLLPDRIRDNSDTPVRPRMRTVRKLTQKLWLGYEKRVQALTQDTAALSGGPPAIKWDAAGADPEKDVDAAKEVMKVQLGAFPNTMVLNGGAARALRRTLKDEVTALTLQEKIGFSDLPESLWGLRILVGNALENTANPGQPQSIADVWTDDVALLYVDPDPGLDSFTFGSTFTVQDLVVTRWREDCRKGDWHEVSWVQDEKRVLAEAGVLIEDVLT